MIDIILGSDAQRIKHKLLSLIDADKQVFGESEQWSIDFADKFFTFEDLEQRAYTPSMFYQRKVIILTLSQKNISNDLDKQLYTFLSRIPNEVYIIIVIDKKPLSKSLLKKIFDSNKVHVIDAMTPMSRNAYLLERAKAKKIGLSAQVMELLQSRVGDDLMRYEFELDKLSVLGREIQLVDIRNLISKELDDNIFLLSDALLKRNMTQTFEVYQDLLSQKIDPLALFGMVGSSLRKNFQINGLLSKGYPSSEVSAMLGITDKQVYFIQRNQNLNPNKVISMLNKLSDYEQRAKNGMIDRFLAFELFLIEATS